MEKLIWVGHRQSDIEFTNDLFNFSITSWGDNKKNNITYYQSEYYKNGLDKKDFIVNEIKCKIEEYNYKVMFYSPTTAYSIINKCSKLSNHIIGLNSRQILDILNNKIETRLWLSNHVQTPRFMTLLKNECNMQNLCKLFENTDEFIIQKNFSSSGIGTYLMTNSTETDVVNRLSDNNKYLVSEYIKPSASVNIHIFILKDDVIVFPGSLQLIIHRNNNFIYSGADYSAYQHIDDSYLKNIYNNSKIIGELLKNNGYMGICGIDFIISDKQVYFVEINPRFQASTLLLNLALSEVGLPSIHKLQLDVFNEIPIEKNELEKIKVNFSYYKYGNNVYNGIDKYNYQLDLYEHSQEKFKILYDGYDRKNIYNNQYLFGVITNGHISSFVNDLMYIHPNIELSDFISNILPLEKNMDKLIRLKIALLNQGIKFDTEAANQLQEIGGYNESVFSSIDITINGIRFNTPINIRLSSLSPFTLSFKKNFILKYCNDIICEVNVELAKSIKGLKTQNNISYNKIAFISGDRLRIKTENKCYYKTINKGCAFCPNNISNLQTSNYAINDIYEVIDYCFSNEKFRHILIGGGTAQPEDKSKKILSTISYISSISEKPIYLMCTPPENENIIKEYVDSGVSEIAFNIELLNRDLAKLYMPGKGNITLEHYINSLKYAVSLLGNTGNVRCMLMVGIENTNNTLKAVKLLCENGIQPMLSIFRPTNNCNLNYIVPPSNKDLLKLFEEAQKICKSFHLTLGPSCSSCQNNTLALTID